MSAYQVMPGLAADEYDALREDIRAHGVRVPVDVDENGQVLDGHHRSLIAAELGVDCPRRVLEGLSDAEKVAHALAVNVHRRNLTREQRRELIAASLRAEPEASNVEHARRTGTSDKTVADVREGMEATSEIPRLDERRGGDGKSRPATVTRRDSSSETFTVDTQTGEVDPEPVDRVADAISEFPDLAYFSGRPAKVIALASELRGYDSRERERRLTILRKSIAADQRREPAAATPDHEAAAQLMFVAANHATQTIANKGGVDVFTAAAETADPLLLACWASEFDDLARTADAIARACAPQKIRRVK